TRPDGRRTAKPPRRRARHLLFARYPAPRRRLGRARIHRHRLPPCVLPPLSLLPDLLPAFCPRKIPTIEIRNRRSEFSQEQNATIDLGSQTSDLEPLSSSPCPRCPKPSPSPLTSCGSACAAFSAIPSC